MPTPRTDKRSQLVQAAGNLVHRHGFSRMTLNDIAQETGVRLGNLYYYFKTKSAIGEAIVQQRADDYRAVLSEWEKLPTAEERILAFIQFTCDSRSLLARSGCPIGTLCMDLRKEDDSSAKAATKSAVRLFAQIHSWLGAQFRELGTGDEAESFATHLMSGLQGASVLAHVFGRPNCVDEEVQHLRNWVNGLGLRRRKERRAK